LVGNLVEVGENGKWWSQWVRNRGLAVKVSAKSEVAMCEKWKVAVTVSA
jgi:hypothetical protein